jgi:hypothetical protein
MTGEGREGEERLPAGQTISDIGIIGNVTRSQIGNFHHNYNTPRGIRDAITALTLKKPEKIAADLLRDFQENDSVDLILAALKSLPEEKHYTWANLLPAQVIIRVLSEITEAEGGKLIGAVTPQKTAEALTQWITDTSDVTPAAAVLEQVDHTATPRIVEHMAHLAVMRCDPDQIGPSIPSEEMIYLSQLLHRASGSDTALTNLLRQLNPAPGTARLLMTYPHLLVGVLTQFPPIHAAEMLGHITTIDLALATATLGAITDSDRVYEIIKHLPRAPLLLNIVHEPIVTAWLRTMRPDRAAHLLRTVPAHRAAQWLEAADRDQAVRALAHLVNHDAARILDAMYPDVAYDLICHRLPEGVTSIQWNLVLPAMRSSAARVLSAEPRAPVDVSQGPRHALKTAGQGALWICRARIFPSPSRMAARRGTGQGLPHILIREITAMLRLWRISKAEPAPNRPNIALGSRGPTTPLVRTALITLSLLTAITCLVVIWPENQADSPSRVTPRQAGNTSPLDMNAVLEETGSDSDHRIVLRDSSGHTTPLPHGDPVEIAVRIPSGWLVRRGTDTGPKTLSHVDAVGTVRQIATGRPLRFWVNGTGDRVVWDEGRNAEGRRVASRPIDSEQVERVTLPTTVDVIDMVGRGVLLTFTEGPDAGRLDYWWPGRPYIPTAGESTGTYIGVIDETSLAIYRRQGNSHCIEKVSSTFPFTRISLRCDITPEIDAESVVDGDWWAISPDGTMLALPGKQGNLLYSSLHQALNGAPLRTLEIPGMESWDSVDHRWTANSVILTWPTTDPRDLVQLHLDTGKVMTVPTGETKQLRLVDLAGRVG